MRLSIWMITALSLAISTSSWAGVWAEITGTYSQSNETVNNLTTTDQRLISTESVGYAFAHGFLIAVEALDQRGSAASSSTFAWGPRGGLLIKGFELTGTYLVNATDNRGSSQRTGAGFSGSVGYTLHLTGILRLGLDLTYWYMSFNNQDGAQPFVNPTLSYLTPQAAIVFAF